MSAPTMSYAAPMAAAPMAAAPMMAAPTMSYAAPMQTYAAPVQTYTQPMVQQPREQQVYTEQVTIPQTYTTMVNQTTYQNKTIQVPVQQAIRVPRTYYETQPYQYQEPRQ